MRLFTKFDRHVYSYKSIPRNRLAVINKDTIPARYNKRKCLNGTGKVTFRKGIRKALPQVGTLLATRLSFVEIVQRGTQSY